MKMETTSGGGVGKVFSRMMSGESLFLNRYTAQNGQGMIAFASSFPGSMRAINISANQGMIVQKSAFLAAESGVQLSIAFQKKNWWRILWWRRFYYATFIRSGHSIY